MCVLLGGKRSGGGFGAGKLKINPRPPPDDIHRLMEGVRQRAGTGLATILEYCKAISSETLWQAFLTGCLDYGRERMKTHHKAMVERVRLPSDYRFGLQEKLCFPVSGGASGVGCQPATLGRESERSLGTSCGRVVDWSNSHESSVIPETMGWLPVDGGGDVVESEF